MVNKAKSSTKQRSNKAKEKKDTPPEYIWSLVLHPHTIIFQKNTFIRSNLMVIVVVEYCLGLTLECI
jgi:hypothetical protein